jgi:hypothetical protein
VAKAVVAHWALKINQNIVPSAPLFIATRALRIIVYRMSARTFSGLPSLPETSLASLIASPSHADTAAFAIMFAVSDPLESRIAVC